MIPIITGTQLFRLAQTISRFFLLGFILAGTAQAASAANEDELLKQINQAKQRLEQTQERIADNRSQLAKQITKLEQQVTNLRAKTAAARRAKDEQTLSLQTLEERLEQWQQQQDHQQNAITRLLQQSGMDYQAISQLTQDEKLQKLKHEVDMLLQATSPDWHQQNAILPNGHQVVRPVLALGPIRLVAAAQSDTNNSVTGLGSPAAQGVELEYIYDKTASQALLRLHETGSAAVTFDPTLGKAQQNNADDKTLWQYLKAGGLWIIPILIAALVSFIMAAVKGRQLYHAPAINQRVQHPMQKRLKETIDSNLEPEAKEDKLVAQIQWMRFSLHKGLTVITVIATIAPLLGLLGTVSGMITTFNMMAMFGTSDPQVVSGGIGQALITTELGLVVAIPSLILSAVLTRKAKNDSEKLQQYAVNALERHKNQKAEI